MKNNANGTLKETRTTDGSGWIHWWILTEFIRNQATWTHYTAHDLFAENATYYGISSPYMDSSKTITLSMNLQKLVYNIDLGVYNITIQEAIDFANPGNTILVNNGTFTENVVIDKPLTLKGWDRNTTTIDGSRSGHVVMVISDWVNITNFKITKSDLTGSASGIVLDQVQNCSIASNNI